ncbi:MAG: carboxypeptidase-like regulatory domain-containing protein, partial [Actinomycetota bacterium]|nr:carboxypeptidase-like regulatory domain-containing protein [Actinomycetota bacterium]
MPFAALLSLGTPAEATHELTHRYVVLGYVRDGTHRPIAGGTVEVVREKTGLSYFTESDAQGFYVVVVHLQDEDLLDTLRVNAGRATIRIQARFNPLNSRSHRGTRVDFT